MLKRSPTSYDVARAAGVSQSAVSRAFSPGGVIADEKRTKIFDVARALGYQPNAIARSMSSARTQSRQKSGIVGVIVTRLEDPFFSRILNMFSRILQEKGWHVLLFTVESQAEVDEALNQLLQYKIDGVVIFSAILSQKMAEGCRNQGTPVVLYNRYSTDAGISSVRVKNLAGGRMAADLLLGAGHKRIAFIAGDEREATSHERERGFTSRLKKAGADLFRREGGDYTFESGFEAARRLLSARQRPDAIFCASDVMALGVLHAAREEFGLSIPGDFSLIGFDDIPAASWPGYRLTTIRQPVEDMTRETVKILIDMMEQPGVAARVRRFPGTLIERETVRR